MKHILVIDDTPSKVTHLEKLVNENCTVTFVTTFIDARKIMKEYPQKFDTIYLDHDLDNRKTGIDLLRFLVKDKVLKPGCRIKPNSASDKCNTAIKQTILELGLSRLQQKKLINSTT